MDFREDSWSERVLAALRGRSVPLTDSTARYERERLRARLMVWGCRIGIVLLVASLPWGLASCASVPAETAQAAPAAAEIPVHVHESPDARVRLMPGPCVEPRSVGFLTQAGPDEVKHFHAVESTWRYPDGSWKAHVGCWREFSAQETGRVAAFFMIFDDGQRYLIPRDEFLRGKGQGT